MDEPTTLSPELRTQIIIAAVQAAGPIDSSAGTDANEEWRVRVSDAAANITAMTSPQSDLSKLITSVSKSKVFPATVKDVAKEKSSTRGLVTLKTRPSKHHEDGIEQARTERTDNPIGLAMAKRFRSLIGHKVLIYIEVETFGDGDGKVRVIRHVVDRGIDPEFAESES